MRAVWGAIGGLLMVGCRRTPVSEQTPAKPPASVEVGALARASVWSFSACHLELCLHHPQRGIYRLTPSLERGDAVRHQPWVARKIEALPGPKETDPWSDCLRGEDGAVVCEGKPIASNIRSITAFPYLLGDGGKIFVAPAHDDREGEQAARETIVRDLPPITRVVSTGDATCALDADRHVWCWSEPFWPVSTPEQRPLLARPQRVPGLADVEDITLQHWMNLCARTADGRVRCSEATPSVTQSCILRGPSEVRCGAVRMPSSVWEIIQRDPVAPTYNPRTLLQRPLVATPVAEHATLVAGYQTSMWSDGESERRRLYSDNDINEGGCALTSDGRVHCWERESYPGPRHAPWRGADVAGLPGHLRTIVLGSRDGYALDDAGKAWRWERPRSEYTRGAPLELRATELDLGSKVVAMTAGWFRASNAPMSVSVDCAALADGDVQCWMTEGEADAPSRVTFSDEAAK